MSFVETARENKEIVPQLYPEAHLLQLPEWAIFKGFFGWKSSLIQSESAAAQILFKTLPMGYSIAYIPKGPLGTDWKSLWPLVDEECQRWKAVFLQVEPDLSLPVSEEVLTQFSDNFTVEEKTIQPRRTVVISLEPSEEELLAGMKQKTRYNTRLAAKKGVSVQLSTDVKGFYDMILTTGNRDGFAVHSLDYYQKAYDIFAPKGKCALLRASHQEKDLAYLMLFLSGKRAWYFYGASDNSQRNLMSTYLLQWEAMRWAKENGALEYDLWGIPDADESVLESEFTKRSDGLWGVYRFKRGFGGEVVRTSPAFVRVYHPLLYRVYEKIRSNQVED